MMGMVRYGPHWLKVQTATPEDASSVKESFGTNTKEIAAVPVSMKDSVSSKPLSVGGEAAELKANPASDFKYSKSDGKVTITRLKRKKIRGKVVIPSQIDGLPVVSIGYGAFGGCTGLILVTIPSSVTSIGEDTFGESFDLAIHAPSGSYAEKYAKEGNIPFMAD
ncbi:MAG: hypothetical protein PHE53_05100 [Thermoguttaceae bacterium]|nr:hypothetical protein [Thermoguttaceae bacterium]